MKTLKNWISYQYNTIHNYISYYIKKQEADRLHATTGKRYHIVPSGKRGLIVVDNSFVKTYNSMQPKGKRITINDLLKMSYYSTSVNGLNRESRK